MAVLSSGGIEVATESDEAEAPPQQTELQINHDQTLAQLAQLPVSSVLDQLEINHDEPAAPRVDIEGDIYNEYYFTALDGASWVDPAHNEFDKRDELSLGLLTFCVLVLKNGFTVTGESACTDPESFDEELGRKIAREKAMEKIGLLRYFALKQRIHEQNNGQIQIS